MRSGEVLFERPDFNAHADLKERGLALMPILFDDEEGSWDNYDDETPRLAMARLDSLLHQFNREMRTLLPEAVQAKVREAKLGRPSFMHGADELDAIGEEEADNLYQALGTRYLLRTRYVSSSYQNMGHMDPNTGLTTGGNTQLTGTLYGEIFDLTTGALVWRGKGSSQFGDSIFTNAFRGIMLASAEALVEELYGIPR